MSYTNMTNTTTIADLLAYSNEQLTKELTPTNGILTEEQEESIVLIEQLIPRLAEIKNEIKLILLNNINKNNFSEKFKGNMLGISTSNTANWVIKDITEIPAIFLTEKYVLDTESEAFKSSKQLPDYITVETVLDTSVLKLKKADADKGNIPAGLSYENTQSLTFKVSK